MPVDSFRFVSPGVFINEIDQSTIPQGTTIGAGPVIFGVAEKGPALVPTRVSSFSEFVSIFGNPIPGAAANGDVWRQGNYSNPTYGAYAAQAYLANGAPLTFIRLVGDQESGGTGKAGWDIPKLAAATSGLMSNTGASLGLFVAGDSSETGQTEGTLLAIFQVTGSDTTVELTGEIGGDGGTATTAACAMIRPAAVTDSTGTVYEYRVRISGSNGIEDTTFNLDPKSSRYIRSVFNTNPQLLNSDITPAANLRDYFLAETYERNAIDNISNLYSGDSITRTNLSGTLGVVLGLVSGSVYGGDHQQAYVSPATPWIVAQDEGLASSFDVNDTAQRLFRVHSREGTEYAQNHYKISISDIKQSSNPLFQPYGTFSLLVRDITDTDEDPRILEQFNNLDLNPASLNFIGKRIGDRSYSYDAVNQKWTEIGQYPVLSSLVRVELDSMVENGDQDASLLPFGFRGIPVYSPAQLQSGSSEVLSYDLGSSGSLGACVSIIADGASGSMPAIALTTNTPLEGVAVDFGTPAEIAETGTSASCLVFPALPQRSSAADGRLGKNTNAFFGLSTNQAANTLVFDGSIRDLVRITPASTTATNVVLSPGFSLDDLVWTSGVVSHSGSDLWIYNDGITGDGSPLQPNANSLRRGTPEGGRRDGTSMTAVSSSYTEPLNLGYNKFTVPLYGGFDGFDIFEKDPFNQTRALDVSIDTKTTSAYPMYYTLRKAIDSVRDVDQININMAAMPGITDEQTTDYLIAMAEERKDTLAIIDLEGGYTASTENNDSFVDRIGSSANTVTHVESRNFNSSYAASYYPWVQIDDPASKQRLWVPPSAIAMGVLAASAARSELWFAPAGFNRGGLNNSSAGLKVVNVLEKLTASQRDDLYEVNVNPIASFPAEGIVVFGQKTLQAAPSALDRINVRRLMIHLKKEIRLIANNILFDPNEMVTWNRFLNRVNPFLDSVKNRFGLSEYRVVLDSSTTTPDMVDRNILYAKILLKPTRAIEFIALDFVITRAGADFG
jgi:hypothetical protein